jgi:hypothetical protein
VDGIFFKCNKLKDDTYIKNWLSSIGITAVISLQFISAADAGLIIIRDIPTRAIILALMLLVVALGVVFSSSLFFRNAFVKRDIFLNKL